MGQLGEFLITIVIPQGKTNWDDYEEGYDHDQY